MGSVKVAKAALGHVGKEFNPGVPEQCMAFVRSVLREAKSPVADKVTRDAVDKLETSYYLASSLAGRDCGYITDKIANLEEGSVVFFEDTYGNWPAGTITHVGIYVGDGKFVHRPTAARPVEVAYMDRWAGLFRCGLVLPKDETVIAPAKPLPPMPPQPKRLKLFAHSGKLSFLDETGKAKEFNHMAFDMEDGKLVCTINGASTPFKFITIEVVQ